MYKKKTIGISDKNFHRLNSPENSKKRETNRQKKNQFNEIKKFTEIDKS